MAIRLKHRVYALLYRESTMKNGLWTPDPELAEVISDKFLRTTDGVITVESNTSFTLPFGDVAAVKGLFVEVSADCLLKLNGDATGLQLRITGGETGKVAKFFIEGDISQAIITAQGTQVEGVFVLWGDIVP